MKLPKFGAPLPANHKQLILGKPSQQLFPLKYPWIWEMYLDAQANHWSPQEVAMGQDRLDYAHKLTDEERHMYDWALSMLTTQDLVVMGNLEEGIERHLTCPEASMYLARQTDEESLHTHGYQLLVEALALDENTVYERYLYERTLYAKVEYAYGWHRRLMNLRLDTSTSYAAIGDFIKAMAFWALGMEGGWFYCGFNWIYALHRRGMMPGSSEMFQLIQRDEGVHMNFWIKAIQTIINEYPEAYTPRVQATITTMLREVADLEHAYANDVCKGVIGINAKSYMGHFRNRLNISARKLGLSSVFTPADSVPLPWAGEFEKLKEKNFFETRVTEYQTGTLTWDDNADMQDLSDWRDK